MKVRMATIGALIAGATVVSSLGAAQAQTCEELWVERNSIYKERGYCFKTARGIRYFGNAGCQYDSERDVPLSQAERARIAAIVRTERAMGCR
jgi:hypothetical protein